MGIVGDMAREAARGLVRGLIGEGDSRPPSTATTVHNYYAQPGIGAPQNGWVLVPGDVEPSELAISFSSAEENYIFTTDQPVMLHVFSLTDDAEVTGGCSLGDEVGLEVAPGAYGVLAIVFLDDDFEVVDGVGFGIAEVEDLGLMVEIELGIVETDDTELDGVLEDLDEALAELLT